MNAIDKDIQKFALFNMMAAIISSPGGLQGLQENAKNSGRSIDTVLVETANAFALSGLRAVEQGNFFSFPPGPLSDLLTMFIEVGQSEGRELLEDGLQEGELIENAIALLTDDASRWVSDSGNGDAPVEFPGTGAIHGPERLHDLIRAAAYVMAEIGRVGRVMDREDAHAASMAERGTAIAPGSDDASLTGADAGAPTNATEA